MSRTRHAVASRRRRKRVLKRAKGFRGGRSTLIRTAKETVMRAERFAYRDRRVKKRDFRRLWITRISAALDSYDINYSRFMHGITLLGQAAGPDNAAAFNRKTLSELAIHDPEAFGDIVKKAQEALKP